MRGSALIALAADLAVGEPHASIHPTIAMGKWIARGRRRRRAVDPAPSLIEGIAVVLGGALVFGAGAELCDSLIGNLPRALGTAARGLALKPTLSVRALLEAAEGVQGALDAGDLAEARRELSWHLVSRDTTELSASEVAGAAIESVAENFNDGVVAPLCAFRLAGLTGAYVFRFLNTADAMLGYRSEELEWFGKAAARLDDAAGIIPARLSALLIAMSATAHGFDGLEAIGVALRCASDTDSPNAGWPMATMAGALGVRLEKRGQYALNAAAREPTANDIGSARTIVLTASILAAALVDLL